jgi:hypothetical protein
MMLSVILSLARALFSVGGAEGGGKGEEVA